MTDLDTPTARIDALVREADATPYGARRRELLEEAHVLCVESGDTDREYRVRMHLTGQCSHANDTDAMLTHIAWCVGMHDADPARYPTSGPGLGSDLLWHLKWGATALATNPEFPADQVRAVVDDVDERYRRAGVGRSGPLAARFEVAARCGWVDEAADALVALETTERDDWSDCEACVLSVTAAWLAEVGRTDEAVRRYEEIAARDLVCVNEPGRSFSDALLPYLRAGRLDEARTLHLRSYRHARRDTDGLYSVSRNLIFCAVTGNHERGLALLERHLALVAHNPLDAAGRFDALRATGLLLDAVTAAGHGEVAVRGSGSLLEPVLGPHDGPWCAAELADAAWLGAERVAAAFDARNGSDRFARRLAATRALADEHYDVPVAADGAPWVPVEVTEPDPDDAEGWATRARERRGVRDWPGTLAAVERGLALAGEDASVRANLLRSRALVLAATGRPDEADAAVAERARALREGGFAWRADVADELGLALLLGAVPEGADEDAVLATLLARADEAEERADEDVATDAHLAAVRILANRGEQAAARELCGRTRRLASRHTPAWASATYAAVTLTNPYDEGGAAAMRALLDELLDGDGPLPSRPLAAEALAVRARLKAMVGDFEAALADVDRALELSLALGARQDVADAATLSAAVLDDLGRPHDAISRMRLAVQQARLAESSDLPHVQVVLARRLVRVGAPDDALDVLHSALDDASEAGASPYDRGEVQEAIAHAAVATGDVRAASAAWLAAADLLVEHGDPVGALRMRAEEARQLRRFGYSELAAERFDAMVGPVRETDDAELLTDVLHQYGQCLGDCGREDALEVLAETADRVDVALAQARAELEGPGSGAASADDGSDGHGDGDGDRGEEVGPSVTRLAWLAADVQDSRARALARLERVDEAVAVALRAADAFEEVGDVPAAAWSLELAGRVLVGADRPGDAAPLLRSAADRLVDVPDARVGVLLGLADALAAAGRPVDAAAVREEAGGLSRPSVAPANG